MNCSFKKRECNTKFYKYTPVIILVFCVLCIFAILNANTQLNDFQPESDIPPKYEHNANTQLNDFQPESDIPPKHEHQQHTMVTQLSPEFQIIVSETSPHFAVSVYAEGDIVSNNIKKYGYWDGALTEIVEAILDSRKDLVDKQTIVDFGANVGWFSLLAASKGHHSIAIEPMESNRKAFNQSIALNHFNGMIELHAGALGDGTPASPKELCIGSRVKGYNVGNGQTKSVTSECAEVVPVLTLTSIVGKRKVDFMKADCEGCEANAIMGMTSIITGSSPPCSMSIEWRPGSMKELGGDPQSATELLLKANYMFFHQHGNLVTGEGLVLKEFPSSEIRDKLPTGSFDLILLHDSKECFARDGTEFKAFFNRISAFKPKLKMRKC